MKKFDLRKPHFHILLIVLLSLISYTNTFDVPFLFDDYKYIVENPRIKSLSNIPSFFTDIKGPKGPNPFTLTTFAINFYLGGLNTFGYHVFNIMLHISNGILLYCLIIITAELLNYTKKNVRLIALFSSLVFITHPIQTECVTNVVGRSLPLVTTFFLSGIILFVKAVTSGKLKSLYSMGLFLTSLLGMATSERFVTFPVILIFYDFFFVSRYKVKSVIQNYKIHIPVMLTLVYLAYLVLSYEYQTISLGLKIATPTEYLLTQFNVHWTYLRLLVLPINQTIDYDYSVSRTLFELPTIFSAIGYAGIWTAGIYLWRRNPVLSFCILWFMITLSPVSSIVPLNNMIFEHRLYLPSIGIFIAIITSIFIVAGKLKENWKLTDRTVVMVLSVIVIALVGATLARNSVWKDEVSLWEDTVRKSPRNAKVHNNLGNVYESRGLIDKAIEHYQTALKLNPYIPAPYYNLANVYMSRGLIDRAIEHYQTALKLNPDYVDAYNNLGFAYQAQGLIDKAIEHYQTALKLNPYIPTPYYNLANVYMSRGLIDKAIEHYQMAIRIDPDYALAHNNLGNAYRSLGLLDKAIKQYLIATKIDPEIPGVYYNLGIAYQLRSSLNKAIENYQTAILLNPQYAQAYNNLGNAYRDIGLLNRAMENYNAAIRLKPEWEIPHLKLGRIYLEKGDLEKARSEFEKTLRINPRHHEARKLLNSIITSP